MSEEKTIFRASSSQVLNLTVFAACGLATVALVATCFLVKAVGAWPLVLLPVPLGIATGKWLKVKCRVYEVTTERIRVSDGIVTRRTEELELYRVEDISLVEPFFLRFFGLGNIVLATNDTSSPTLELPAIRGVKQLREDLRKAVEERREKKRVRVTEME